MEYNGKYYKFVNTDNEVQWFTVKGHCEFPELPFDYVLTLGRMWMAEKQIGVKYDMSADHITHIRQILNVLYENKCHSH